MKILHVDTNHPLLLEQLEGLGFTNDEDYRSSRDEVMKKIGQYDGLIIRSRFPVDREFLDAAGKLKFIGRVGAGLENIDTEHARHLGIELFNAPEGNRNAVGAEFQAWVISIRDIKSQVRARNNSSARPCKRECFPGKYSSISFYR